MIADETKKSPLSEAVQIDDLSDVITIYGIRYSGELFRGIGFAPKGRRFEIGERKDGVVTVHLFETPNEERARLGASS